MRYDNTVFRAVNRLFSPSFHLFCTHNGTDTGEEKKWVLKHDFIHEDDDSSWETKPLSESDQFRLRLANKPDHSMRRMKRRHEGTVQSTSHVNDHVDNPHSLSKIRGFLEFNPHVCSGCGAAFQSKTPNHPGYLSKDKFALHLKTVDRIKQQKEAIKLLDMAGIDATSDLAKDILRKANMSEEVISGVVALGKRITVGVPKDVVKARIQHEEQAKRAAAQERAELAKQGVKMESDWGNEPIGYHADTLEPIYDVEELRRSFDETYNIPRPTAEEPGDIPVAVCQRCFRLDTYNDVKDDLRPGWSTHEDLTPERFQNLLSTIRDHKAVVLCLVDLFDIEGSVVSNLKEIAGRNPIVVVANKSDLLPNDASLNRVCDWVYHTVKQRCGLMSAREAEAHDKHLYATQGWFPSRQNSEEGILRRDNVHLISCAKGKGLQDLIDSVMGIAVSNGQRIYVMGTANVGKSSFINQLLKYTKKKTKPGKRESRNNVVPKPTVSALPGTTLDFLKIKLPNGITMIDTPGLINPGQLTSRLNSKELKQVIPVKQVHHVTLRMEEGRCVLIGGLARVELVEGRPMFCTFFMSNEIKLHPTSTANVDEFLEKHTGSLVFPPYSHERVLELGPLKEHVFEVSGSSWRRAARDIVIAGLGWVSITGPGTFRIKVSAPEGTVVSTRDPLMPFEAMSTTVKHSGGRLIQKGKASRKGYAWRA